MANYNTQFCFAIQLPDPEPALQEVRAAIAAQIENPVDDHSIFGDQEQGFPDVTVSGDLLIFTDDAGESSVEVTANLVQWVLEHAGGAPESVGFQWASTCSKSRVDAFGGGCVFITATDQRWLNTSNALANLAAGGPGMVALVASLASCIKSGEPDPSGDPGDVFEMQADDAISTMHLFIDQARSLVGNY